MENLGNTKFCSKCKCIPKLVFDGIGFIFWLSCPKCGKSTQEILAKNASIGNIDPDEETMTRLVSEWDSIA